MSVVNYTLPFGGGMTVQNWATISPLQQHATAVNNLLYGPAGHEESDLSPEHDYYENNPYAPPQQRPTQQFRTRNNNYLPPPPVSQQPAVPQQFNTAQPTQSQHAPTRNHYHQSQPTRTYGEGSYAKVPPRDIQPPNTQYFNSYNSQRITYNSQQTTSTATVAPAPPTVTRTGGNAKINGNGGADGTGVDQSRGSSATDTNKYPSQTAGFTRVHAGQGSRTQVHAVLDYDDDEGDYYDAKDDGDPVGIPGELNLFKNHIMLNEWYFVFLIFFVSYY